MLVVEGLFLVLFVDNLLEHGEEFARGEFVAIAAGAGVDEEEFEGENTPLRAHIFIGGGAGDDREVAPGDVLDILEAHRLEFVLVAGEEEIVLNLHDSRHSRIEGLLALAEDADEIGSRLIFLAYKRGSLGLLAVFAFGRSFGIHARETLLDLELGDVVYEGEDEGVAIDFDREIGDNLLGVGLARRTADSAARLGIERADAVDSLAKQGFIGVESRHDAGEMLFGELVEVAVDDLVGEQAGRLGGAALELEEETLAEVGGGDTGGLKVVDHLEHLLHIVVAHIHPHLEHQVVADFLDGALEIAVVVDIADDIFCNSLLPRREVALGDLVVQEVDNRRFCHHDGFALLIVGAGVGDICAVVRDIVFVAIIGELHLLRALVESVAVLVAVVGSEGEVVIRGVFHLESRVVVDFVAHLLLDFGAVHLHEAHILCLQR